MAKFVGNRTRSKEGPRHATGRGLYTDDFRLPGMLQAMILRSPHAHAHIRRSIRSFKKSRRRGGSYTG